ncbi:MAG: hypothetical protein FWD62_03790 [Betaproteobacteria bacterium]|nr:hypothetical protein [Betaproteobacteria bacterium]
MSRQILSDNQTAPAPQSTESAQTQTTPGAFERPLNEVLAGALPEWDLLPEAPFVRRVKQAAV